MTQWSESESGVTFEAGQAQQDDGQSDASSAAPCPRCVMPRVELPALNRSDQRAPVFWDQIVPVWQSADLDSCRRRPAQSGSNCAYLRSSPGNEDEVVLQGGGRRRSSSSSSSSGNEQSKVSFDDIMSMYQSSKPSTTAMV